MNSNNSLTRTRQSAVSGACLESYGTLQQVERMGGVLGNAGPTSHMCVCVCVCAHSCGKKQVKMLDSLNTFSTASLQYTALQNHHPTLHSIHPSTST